MLFLSFFSLVLVRVLVRVLVLVLVLVCVLVLVLFRVLGLVLVLVLPPEHRNVRGGRVGRVRPDVGFAVDHP